MSQIYACDKCHESFGGPLDTEIYNEKLYDLCAPCRKLLSNMIDKAKKDFFEGGDSL